MIIGCTVSLWVIVFLLRTLYRNCLTDKRREEGPMLGRTVDVPVQGQDGEEDRQPGRKTIVTDTWKVCG